MAIDLEHLRTALNRLSDTLDPKEGPVILAWSVDRLAEALATELAELSRPVGPGVARVPVDEPDPGWVERLRGTVVDEARRVAVTSTPEAATETCEQPVWDGPYWMQCGRLIVNGWCGRHGADWRYSSPPAPSGLQRATEQPDPLDICAQCGFWRMAHDRNTHIFAGAAVDPTTHLMVLVDGDDCCVLSVHWGNGNSDPVWYVDVTLSGTQLGRWICRAYWPVRHRLDRRKART